MKLAVTKMNNVALESSINEDRSHISSRKQKSLDLLGEKKKKETGVWQGSEFPL